MDYERERERERDKMQLLTELETMYWIHGMRTFSFVISLFFSYIGQSSIPIPFLRITLTIQNAIQKIETLTLIQGEWGK